MAVHGNLRVLKQIINASFMTTLLCSYSGISYAESTTPNIAVGYYKQSTTNQPLILVGDNEGKQWSLVNIQGGGELDAVSCHGDLCVVMGVDSSSSPLILSSRNGGHAWQPIKISGLSANFARPILNDLSCVGNICNMSGTYVATTESESVRLPLFLISYDSGQSWAVNQNISGLPSHLDLDTSSVSLNCTDKTCIAVSSNQPRSNESAPVILNSSDSGQSWVYTDNISHLPSEQTHQPVKATCEGNHCVAVGTSWNTKARNSNPLILSSDNYGKSWNYISFINGFIPSAQLLSSAFLGGVICKGKTCFAGGGRFLPLPSLLGNYPLLLVSQDTGKTWSFSPVYIPTKPLIAGTFGGIYDGSCMGAHCVAIGALDQNGIESTSFLVATHDAGKSFARIENINGAPADWPSNLYFDSVSCSNNKCIVSGSYKIAEKKYKPVFLIGKDNGTSWELTQNVAGLPQDTEFSLRGLTGSKVGIHS